MAKPRKMKLRWIDKTGTEYKVEVLKPTAAKESLIGGRMYYIMIDCKIYSFCVLSIPAILRAKSTVTAHPVNFQTELYDHVVIEAV